MAWSDDARVVDVSHWQPADDRPGHRGLDWAAAVKAGLVGAIIKYSQGVTYADPAAYAHAWRIWSAGVPLIGCYHFGDGSDPAKQAEHFLELVHDDWGTDISHLMLMLDVERNPASQMSVAKAEIFVETVNDREGRWPWLYMGRSGPDGTGAGLASPVLSRCPLLLPKYGPAPTTASLPPGFRFPRDAEDRGEPGRGVVRGWQFTDGRTNGGPFPGLGRVDQSRLFGVASLDEARAVWLNATG